MNKYFYLAVILFGLTSCDSGGGSSGGSNTPDKGYRRIFVTVTSTTGDIDTNNDGNPSTEADAICANDANNPNDGATFKALLVSSVRRACSTASCSGGTGEHLDWVLKSSMEYRRLDKTTKIKTANAFGIFDFPLDNGVEATFDIAFTGLSQDWTNNSGRTCLNWNSSSGSEVGEDAVTSYTSAQSIAVDVSGGPCTNTSNLYCVEQ